mgnify:CR=1 FL=1
MTSNKYKFTLSNINLEEISKKFNIDISLKNKTLLTELGDNTSDTISFLDETKRLHTCSHVSKLDNINKKYNCFWCRYEIESIPICCPIKFIPTQIQRSITSHNKNYILKENISKNNINTIDNSNLFWSNNDSYYETDGIFCSFNCCQSWINDNKHKSKYNDSTYLLRKMYKDMTGNIIDTIKAAPNWRLLDSYGGNLSIEDFRNNFTKFDYLFHGTILSNVLYNPYNYIYESKLKF